MLNVHEDNTKNSHKSSILIDMKGEVIGSIYNIHTL